MLIEQKIIQLQSGAKILLALQKQNSQKLGPNAEDVHMAVEEAVLKEQVLKSAETCTLPKAATTK
jgi:argininosuccinate lyase